MFSRTRERASPLLEKGAKWADSPKAVAESSDVTFTMVGFPKDVREVFPGPSGVLAGARPCSRRWGRRSSVKAGLSPETMLTSISGGAAGCWALSNLAPRILKRNIDPGFFVEHFVKDMGIALDETRRMNLPLPGLALVHQMYVSLAANGGGKHGTRALMLVLEKMSKTEIEEGGASTRG